MSSQDKAEVQIKKVEGTVYPIWSCEKESLSKDLSKLNVADPFTLNCSGDFIEPLGENLKIKVLDKGHPYSLKILKVIDSESEQIKLKATSYITGEKKIKFQILNAQNKGVQVNELSLNTKSVIDPKEGMPNSFTLIGPLQLNWPMWFLVVCIGLLVVFLISGLMAAIRSLAKGKKLKSIMMVNDQDLKALKKYERYKVVLKLFIKNIRQYRREFLKPEALRTKDYTLEQYSNDLHNEFVLYISRLFAVPFDSKKQRQILRFLKKKHPFFYDTFSKDFNYLLNELDGISEEDADKESMQRLFDNLLLAAEKISAHLRRLS